MVLKRNLWRRLTGTRRRLWRRRVALTMCYGATLVVLGGPVSAQDCGYTCDGWGSGFFCVGYCYTSCYWTQQYTFCPECPAYWGQTNTATVYDDSPRCDKVCANSSYNECTWVYPGI
jgi:hypothetical protein